MCVDSIAFPLPVVIKGYACLTKADMDLANKDIDPARPHDGPNDRHRRDAPATAIPTSDTPAERPVEDAAPELDGRILSYTPESVRTVAVEKATRYSTTV